MKIPIYTITPIWRGRPSKTDIPHYYSLVPYHPRNWYIKARDDGGRMYELPEGYQVINDPNGQKSILDAHGWVCSITRGTDGFLEMRGYDIYHPVKLVPTLAVKPWTAFIPTNASPAVAWATPNDTPQEPAWVAEPKSTFQNDSTLTC